MSQEHLSQADALDEHLTILSDQHRRAVISYFQNATEPVVSLDTLATELTIDDTETLTAKLRHSTLTNLERADIINYDENADMVHYRGHTAVESLLDKIYN